MLNGLKVIKVFWPNEHSFKIFTCSSLESSFVDFAEIIKRFKLKSVSVINSQLFWWTNYSVMWHCNLHPCFGDRSLLHVFCLQHFISCFYLAHCFFSVAISFLLPPMYVRNGLKRLISYSWNKWKVLPFWSHNQNNSTLSPRLLG